MKLPFLFSQTLCPLPSSDMISYQKRVARQKITQNWSWMEKDDIATGGNRKTL